MKKTLISFVLGIIIVLSVITTSFAESEPIYSAGTCHIGFTTSRYVDRNGNWNDTISVYNYYVIWDDSWEFDFYQLTFAKKGSIQLSDPTKVFTGYYEPNNGGPVYYNASTNKNLYTPLLTEIELYENAASYNRIYLRINKPNVENYLFETPIYNMKTRGWFTK